MQKTSALLPITFFIKDDTVVVSSSASSEKERLGNDLSGDYFVRNISRFEDIIQNIKKDWAGMPKPMARGDRRGNGRGGRARGGRRDRQNNGRNRNSGRRGYSRN